MVKIILADVILPKQSPVKRKIWLADKKKKLVKKRSNTILLATTGCKLWHDDTTTKTKKSFVKPQAAAFDGLLAKF